MAIIVKILFIFNMLNKQNINLPKYLIITIYIYMYIYLYILFYRKNDCFFDFCSDQNKKQIENLEIIKKKLIEEEIDTEIDKYDFT